jgi:hypothetical protein
MYAACGRIPSYLRQYFLFGALEASQSAHATCAAPPDRKVWCKTWTAFPAGGLSLSLPTLPAVMTVSGSPPSLTRSQPPENNWCTHGQSFCWPADGRVPAGQHSPHRWSQLSPQLPVPGPLVVRASPIHLLDGQVTHPLKRPLPASPSADHSPEPLRGFGRFSAASEDPEAEPADAARGDLVIIAKGSLDATRPTPVEPDGWWETSDSCLATVSMGVLKAAEEILSPSVRWYPHGGGGGG